MDQRTRTVMTMHKALHLTDDINRLHMSRKGEIGLASLASNKGLEGYIKDSKVIVISAASYSNSKLRKNPTKSTKNYQTRKQKWEEKQWIWLRVTSREKLNLFLQKKQKNNDIRTTYVNAKIDSMQQNSKCRLCGNGNEMVNHIFIAVII